MFKKMKTKVNYFFFECVHAIYIRIARFARRYPLEVEQEKLDSIDSPVIFACNHSNSHDFYTIQEVFKKNIIVFAASDGISFLTRFLFKIVGTVLIERNNKASAKRGTEKLVAHLASKSVILFPEATWNIHPAKPMLPMKIGVIKIAAQSGKPIVPLVFEYIESMKDAQSEMETIEKCVVRVGEPIHVSNSDCFSDKLEELRDQMASLRWRIWEERGAYSRKKIDPRMFKQHEILKCNYGMFGYRYYPDKEVICIAGYDDFIYRTYPVNQVPFTSVMDNYFAMGNKMEAMALETGNNLSSETIPDNTQTCTKNRLKSSTKAKGIKWGYMHFKKILESNKVFFETIVMVVLTLANILLSLTANSLAKRQIELTETLSKPIIDVEPMRNEDGIIEAVNIYNNGTAASEVTIEVAPFYDCILYWQDDIHVPVPSIIQIPIEYVDIPLKIITDQARTGLLGTISFSGETLLYLADMESFKDIEELKIYSDFELGRLSFNYYIRVQYTDIMGNTSTEIHYCRTGASVSYWDLMSIEDSNISLLADGGEAYNNAERLITKQRFDITKESFHTISGYFRIGETPEEVFDRFVKYINDWLI